MRRQSWMWCTVVVLAAGGAGVSACSSVEFPEGTGGAAGTIAGVGGGVRGGRRNRRWPHHRTQQSGVLQPWAPQPRFSSRRSVRHRLPERGVREALHRRLLRDLWNRPVRFQDLRLSDPGLSLRQLQLRPADVHSPRVAGRTLQPPGLLHCHRTSDSARRIDLAARDAVQTDEYRLLHRRFHPDRGARLHLRSGRLHALRERQPLVHEQRRSDGMDAADHPFPVNQVAGALALRMPPCPV